MRNGSLWNNVVFEKEVIFHDFDFETSDLEFWGLETKHLKAHKFVWLGFFFFIIISQLRRLIELKFSQVCYFTYMLRYTNLWEDWSLTNTNSVHSVFNSLWPSLLDASGNCQRPVIILTSVSLHNASHNKPVKNIYSIGHQSCKRMMKEKTSLLQKLIVCFQMPKKGFRPEVFYHHTQTFWWEIIPLSQKLYVTSDGAVSHNVLTINSSSLLV